MWAVTREPVAIRAELGRVGPRPQPETPPHSMQGPAPLTRLRAGHGDTHRTISWKKFCGQGSGVHVDLSVGPGGGVEPAMPSACGASLHGYP